MKSIILSAIILILVAIPCLAEEINGRFVAFDFTQFLSSPQNPTQRLVVEIKDSNGKTKLLRIVYFAPTNGMRDGVEFLSKDTLSYQNEWKLKLHEPVKEKENLECNQFEHYFRSGKKAEFVKGKEPGLRFYSTQFEAKIRFKEFQTMPCLVLESLSKIQN
jgi:hypothetical protein